MGQNIRKRIIGFFFLSILLTCLLTPYETLAAPTSLIIDNVNVYEGMNRSYSQGYLPTVQRDTATIILPLIAQTPLTGDVLTVRPNLGDTGSSPFVFRNYEKNVYLEDNPVSSGDSVISSYLIRFDLPLSRSRINGTYTVTLDVMAQTEEGPVTQSFTTYVVIEDGIDPDDASSAPSTPAPVFHPNITVDSLYRYKGMNRSYEQGYVPSVFAGRATIVLPLICDGGLYRNELTVVPNLGDAATSPFVFKNYGKTVRWESHLVDDGKHYRYAYLLNLDLELKHDRVNGTYPVTLEVQARGFDGGIITESFTVYVNITDGKDPNVTPPPEPPDLAPILTIDSENRYEGMDKAYNQGYLPAVAEGKAVLILPLYSSDKLDGDRIIVTPDLGSPGDSPFVYKNYETVVRLGSYPVNGTTGTRNIYLMRMELELSPDRINGTYPVTLHIQAQEVAGERFYQSFTVYVTITDGKDPDADAAQPSEIPPSQPKLIVASYNMEPNTVFAGEECTVKVTILNTNTDRAVKNLRIITGGDPASLLLQNETNTFYFSGLGAGNTLKLELRYRLYPETPAEAQIISLKMDYEDMDSSAVSAAGEIIIPVRQVVRVEAAVPDIPKEARVGDTLPLSISVMNLGKSTVYNVRYTLEGPGLLSSGPAFIGNLGAGTSKAGELNVFIGTKDMSEGYEGTDKYGKTTGTITLIYEDDTGEENKQTFEIATTILQPLISEEKEQKDEKPETAGQWWISILVLGIGIAGISGVSFYRSRQERKIHENI